jgi:rhamnosyltransferase
MAHTGTTDTNVNNGKETFPVSIIIPAKNEEANIGKCLDAVYRQETAHPVEVIVIDSGSTDATPAIVRQYSPVKLVEIQPQEFGHGKTRNLGAGISGGDYIVFLNADAIPGDNRWLTRLLEPFGKDGNNKIAGVFSRHIPKPGCYLYMIRDIHASMPPSPRPMIRTGAGALDFMIFSTVSCAIPRQVWLKYPFANDIIIAEDQQWARQVLEKGLEIVYQPASMVYHSHNYSPRQLYEIKLKTAGATGKFKNKPGAAVLGFILVTGGLILKIIGDLGFILGQSPQKISLSRKLKEIMIAFKARTAGFRGKYRGWLSREEEKKKLGS